MARANCFRAFVLLAALAVAVVILVGLESASAPQASAQEANCDRPTTGLVSQWEGEGNANDSVGSNNGTLVNGTTFAAGKVGQAFSFDGGNDYVNIPDPSGNTSLNLDYVTVEMWVKHNNSSTTFLFDKRTPGSFTGEYVTLLRSSGEWQGTVDTGAPNYGSGGGNSWILEARTTRLFPANTWTHYALVWDGSALRAYLNGQLAGTGNTGSGVIAKNSNPIILGRRADAGSHYRGLMDEMTIYDRPLSQQEIQTIYCGGNPPSDPPPSGEDTTNPRASR